MRWLMARQGSKKGFVQAELMPDRPVAVEPGQTTSRV